MKDLLGPLFLEEETGEIWLKNNEREFIHTSQSQLEKFLDYYSKKRGTREKRKMQMLFRVILYYSKRSEEVGSKEISNILIKKGIKEISPEIIKAVL